MSIEEAIKHIKWFKTLEGDLILDEKDIEAIDTILEKINDLYIDKDKLQKENKALIKRLEHLCESNTICSYDEVDIKGNYKKDISTLDKLQKENEELKRKTYKAYVNDKGEIQFVFDNYISKDKIRTKIKELSKTQAYKVGLEEYTIKILEELLGE